MIAILIVLALGLAFGSFVTCMSWRLPLEEDLVKKPSYCPSCKAELTTVDLVPLFSYVCSGGKCRHCKAPISIRYPLTEIATAGAFLLIYSQYGISWLSLDLALMAVALLIMIVVDLEHFIIPDEVHIVLLPLGLWFHYLEGTDWGQVAGGFAVGLGLGLLLHYGYRWLRKKDGLGFGDVKFLSVAGVWLTLKFFAPFLLFAGLLGVMTGLLWRALKKGPIFPFGPALAVSLFFCAAFPYYANIFKIIEHSLK